LPGSSKRSEPYWQEQKRDLRCPVCGFRFWTYYTIKSGKPCPDRKFVDHKWVRCPGKLVKSR
jgi:hypothetical protein